MYRQTLHTVTLALAVIALTGPSLAQGQGTGQPGTQMQNRGTSGGAAGNNARGQSPGTIDSGGAHIQGNQQGGQPGTVGVTPGAPSGAPANPCTPELKAQNRC